MKRNLHAIIAVILAVVMVFPTAIFVSAADELKVTVKDGIKADGYPDADREFTKTGTITLAETGTASGTITVPTGYKLSSDVKSSGNGVAKLTLNTTKKTFDITANTLGIFGDTEEFTLTATKSGEDDLTFKLTVTVVAKAILDMKVYGTSDAFEGEKLLTGSEEYNATEDLTITKVEVLYNTAKDQWSEKINASTSNMKLDVYHKEAGKNRLDIRTMVVDLIGDDDYLLCTYTDNAGLKFTKEIDLHVTTSDVEYVDIEPVAGPAIQDEADITEEAFLARIKALVKLNEHEAKLQYSGAEVKTNSKFTITFYEDSQYQSVWSSNQNDIHFKDAYFKVTYEDAIYLSTSEAKKQVKDYFTFSEAIPKTVSINWDKAKTTTYYEGYVIGTKDSDWDGVVVTVTYDDGTKSTFDSIEEIVGLDLVLSALQVKNKWVVIESVEGVAINQTSNLPTGFSLLNREVTSITIVNSTVGYTTYTEGDNLNLSGIKVTVNYNYGQPVTLSLTNDDYFTCSPAHGARLAAGTNSVLIVYSDPVTGIQKNTRLPITVKQKVVTSEVKDVLLLTDGTKSQYYIGQAFDTSGYTMVVTFTGDKASQSVALSQCSNFTITDTSVYYGGKFLKKYSGSLEATCILPASVAGNSSTRCTITLRNISVIERPTLSSITLVYVGSNFAEDQNGTSYPAFLEGAMPTLKDFQILAKYSNGDQQVIAIPEGDEAADDRSGSYVSDGVSHTLSLTPTSLTASDSTIKVTYKEYISELRQTTTKTASLPIIVEIPACILSYYESGSWKYQPYMSFEDALEAAEEYAYYQSSAARKPSIELRKDVVMTSDFAAVESMEINLNGHSLTMIRGELFIRSNSTAAITLVNEGKQNSMLIYSSNANDNIIIKAGDSYVLDASSGNGKYAVTITKPTGGTVTGPAEVTHGHDARFVVTPNKDYEISNVSVKEGSKTKSYTLEDGVITVTDIQGKLTVTVTLQEVAWDNPFTDIYKVMDYYDSIEFVYENGLFEGTSKTKFEPDTTMTRAMFVTVLGRLAKVNVNNYKSSSFKDVPTGQWYSEYVQWAASIGLVNGYGDGRFGPNDPITHAEMYVMMARYAKIIARQNTTASSTTIVANDTKDIPDWAYAAIQYAAKEDFLVLNNYKLTPNAKAKRWELAVLLDSFCTNVLGME